METWATLDWAGLVVRDWVASRFPTSAHILDVGDAYRQALPDYRNLHACRVTPPVAGAPRRLDSPAALGLLHLYDLVLFGDVLERLRWPDASGMLDRCQAAAAIVTFDYMAEPQVSPSLIRRQYPQLQQVAIQNHGNVPHRGFYTTEEG